MQNIIALSGKLTAEHSESYTLSIRLRPGGLSFAAHRLTTPHDFIYQEIDFDPTVPYLTGLKECFFANECLTWSYHRIHILCVTPQYTLVPDAWFDETRSDALMSIAFTTPPSRSLSDEVPSIASHVVYGIDEEVYAFCCRSLPGAQFLHVVSPILSFLHKRSVLLPNCLYVNIRSREMDLFYLNGGKLHMANSYSYEATSDLVYYILYVWKQNGLDQYKDHLHIFGPTDLYNELREKLNPYLQSIYPVEIPSEAYLIGQEIAKAPLDIIALSVCES